MWEPIYEKKIRVLTLRIEKPWQNRNCAHSKLISTIFPTLIYVKFINIHTIWMSDFRCHSQQWRSWTRTMAPTPRASSWHYVDPADCRSTTRSGSQNISTATTRSAPFASRLVAPSSRNDSAPVPPFGVPDSTLTQEELMGSCRLT